MDKKRSSEVCMLAAPLWMKVHEFICRALYCVDRYLDISLNIRVKVGREMIVVRMDRNK